MSHRSDTTTNLPSGVSQSLRNDSNSSKFVLKSNSHVVEESADKGLWDTASSGFVKPEDTNVHSGK